ncbi:sigma-70 family RNA polymerase sigma factor [Achromobacter sp. GG226]|uniref:sigma-70 family RNA polymerase sigma factor n=1 Tax=Verticiella alkaliphila TaxID=2779529 RepID=UPI001C0BC850|nr:sigma-70 family RNA polymerase sigma factor [Verticiella sp. GG226]MBU4609684.1 sigma-70 family RNA polymerase sigma factor [Verticiella sp. GG226]
MTSATDPAASALQTHRRYLLGLAYRMLGSVAEAEDVLQEAWLRWHARDPETVEHPRAFLARVVTRLCLDQLGSARARRETYVGPWLPEPWAEEATTPWPAPQPVELAQDVSVALLLALERLSPLERAVFLLHDVFDTDFDEIGLTLGRSPAACRQLAVRARANVRAERPRYPAADDAAFALAGAFIAASREGNVAALQTLLAEDATFQSDGGGKRAAVLRAVVGRDKVCRLYAGLARKAGPAPVPWRLVRLNGQPAAISLEADGLPQATLLDIRDGRVVTVYVVRNPDKLRHLSAWTPMA